MKNVYVILLMISLGAFTAGFTVLPESFDEFFLPWLVSTLFWFLMLYPALDYSRAKMTDEEVQEKIDQYIDEQGGWQ